MARTYLDQTVYEAALERVRFVYAECDDIIVSMSGGKDSTVLFHLASIVAAETGRFPVKVFWLDQEAEWKATETYMRSVMYSAEVLPFWFQIPFRLTNSLSFRDNFLHCWDAKQRDSWIREQDPISKKENPTRFDRYHDLVAHLPLHCENSRCRHIGVLVGLRAEESLNRYATTMFSDYHYKGRTWCKKPVGASQVFWPIYDWKDADIWTCIAKNRLEYNRVYDYFYQFGVKSKDMRVSALIHETAWHAIERLHEVEPEMYNRYLGRVNGVNCFNQFGKEIMPKSLPPQFRSWLEYRDYLLENLIEPGHRHIFVNRWKKQSGDAWYKAHITEIMVNDIDGTKNDNMRSTLNVRRKNKTVDYARHLLGESA